MSQPTHLILPALLAVLASCTQAEFARISVSGGSPSGGGGASGGGGGAGGTGAGAAGGATVTQPDAALSCESFEPPSGPPTCSSGACPQFCHEYNGAPPAPAAQGTCVIWGTSTSSRQVDNCASGSICLSAGPGSGGSYCYKPCKSLLDCGNVACSIRYFSGSVTNGTTTITACDPAPYEFCSASPDSGPSNCCDPSAATADAGCPTGQTCYLVEPTVAESESATLCDYAAWGNTSAGGQCSSWFDCTPPRLTCVPSPGESLLTAPGICRAVCQIGDSFACGSNPVQCLPMPGQLGNQSYGYCSPGL